MRTWPRRIFYAALLFFLVIQFVRPNRTNPATDAARTIHASLAIEPNVASLLTRSCDNCHSNRTVWPWYSGVAPVSWLVAADVNEGRKAVNFSDWKALNPEKQPEVLREICTEITERKMPKVEYVLIHPRARLTGADVQAICTWVHSVGKVESEEARGD